MYRSEVLRHFAYNQTAVARLLGISTPAVANWSVVIPELSAYRLERLTEGRLKVNPQLYDSIMDRRPVPYAEVQEHLAHEKGRPGPKPRNARRLAKRTS